MYVGSSHGGVGWQWIDNESKVTVPEGGPCVGWICVGKHEFMSCMGSTLTKGEAGACFVLYLSVRGSFQPATGDEEAYARGE